MPTARSRLAAMMLAMAGAIIANTPPMLAGGYTVIAAVLLASGTFRSHARFLLVVVLPMAALSLTVWPFLIGAPPGEVAGTNPIGALRFAGVTVLRLALIGAIFQAGILTVQSRYLAVTFRRWGLRGEWLIAALGAMVLGPEMKRRADRIFTAALARGLLPSRSLWNRIRILPTMLVPLTAWSLRSAISRADVWQERCLLERINNLAKQPDPGSWPIGALYILLASLWVAVAVVSRLGGL